MMVSSARFCDHVSHDCGQTPKAMTSSWTVPALILIDVVRADDFEEGSDDAPENREQNGVKGIAGK